MLALEQSSVLVWVSEVHALGVRSIYRIIYRQADTILKPSKDTTFLGTSDPILKVIGTE